MSSDKYRQGRQDAESGEFNPFFYDLYYDYRLGYDEASGRGWRHRWQSRLPLMLLGLLMLLAAAGGLVLLLRPRDAVPPTVAIAPATPTSVPGTPTSTMVRLRSSPTIPSSTPHLATGQKVVVHTQGVALRVRKQPSLEAEVIMRLQDGSVGTIINGPKSEDNHIWWEVKTDTGRGWCVEAFLKPAADKP